MLYHILSNENSKLLKIDNIGFSEDSKICRFGPGKRDLYLIHYVISGSGTFNGTKVKKGQGFLITPNTYEYYYPDNNDPWKLLWVTFRDTNTQEIFDAYNADKTTQIFEYDYVYEANELTKFLKINHNKAYTPSEILEIFLNLFNNGHKKEICKNSEDLYYNYALNYINSNIFRNIKINELTKVLGISQPYLYKIFIKKINVSPKQYIDNLKIKKAKNLLKNTTMQISEISNSVGFEDSLVFSKFFKRKTNMSPTEYRKNM